MPLPRTIKDNRIYDGKKLWEVFMGMGKAASYEKLNAWAKANGMYNTETGRVSRMGPCWAMWRYALHNPREAYPAFEKWVKEFQSELAESGYEPTFENFLKEIKVKAKNEPVASKPVYQKFCEEWNLTP